MVATVETSPSGRPRTHSHSKQQQQQQQTPLKDAATTRPAVLVAPVAPSLASTSVTTSASHPFGDLDPLLAPLVRSATVPASLRASSAAILAAKTARAAAVGVVQDSSSGLGGQRAFGSQGFGPGHGPGYGLGNGSASGGAVNGASTEAANGVANANGMPNGPVHGFGNDAVVGTNGLASKSPPAFPSSTDSYRAAPDDTFYTSVSPPPPLPLWDQPTRMLGGESNGIPAGGSGGSGSSNELRDSSRTTARQTLALRRPGNNLLLGSGSGDGGGSGSGNGVVGGGGGGSGGGVHSSDLLRVSSAALLGGRRGGSRSRSRRRPRKTWRKLLWVKQSYPDNYTDQATFLEHLQRNPRLKPYDFWPLVADSTVIVQHVCSVILFVVCFMGIFQERVSPVAVVGGGSIATCLGWLLWETWASQEEASEGSDGEEGPYGSAIGVGSGGGGGDGLARYRGPAHNQNSAAAGTGGAGADVDSGLDAGTQTGTLDGLSSLRPPPPSMSLARSSNRAPSPSVLSAGSSTTSLLTMSNKHGRNGHHKHSTSTGDRARNHDSGTSPRTATALHAMPASTQQPPSRQSRHGDSALPLLPSTPATPATPLYPYPPLRRSQTLLVSRGGRTHNRVATVKSAVLIYFTLLGLSPILKSLTRSTSSDSIWAISFWLLTMNILFFDYSGVWVGAHKFPVASLSTNAALMASTVLASRLPSTGQVFSLTLFSIEVFGLFPVFRRYARHRSWRYHISLTALLVLGAGAGVGIIASGGGGNRLSWRGAMAGMVVSGVVSTLAMGGCSWWLIGLQKYKNEIYGPWDPARPIIMSRRHWADA